MAAKKHTWVKRTKRTGTKRKPDFCERCGTDRTPTSEKAACHPTRLPGLSW